MEQCVILSDVLPAGVKLVSGSVTLDGKTVSYGIAGQAIEVTVGDLKPGAEAVVTFDVRVLDSAIGTSVHNVAVAKGENGEKTATDGGVTVSDPEDETPNGGTTPGNTVTGSKMVDKTIVNTGERITYTITAVNNTKDTWAAVQIYDVLDTSVLTLNDDSIFINGIRTLSGSGNMVFKRIQHGVFTFGNRNRMRTANGYGGLNRSRRTERYGHTSEKYYGICV